MKKWIRWILLFSVLGSAAMALENTPTLNYGMGIGVENKGTTVARLNTFSLLVDLTDAISVGGNFGFLNTTDHILLGPKLKHTCFKSKYANFFSQGGFYYRRGLAAGDGLTLDAVGGVEFKLPEVGALGLAIAYGVIADFIDQNDIGVVNSHPFGNFAVHYYF